MPFLRASVGFVTELRDYDAWHNGYDDPDSGLSWRLERVRAALDMAFDTVPGPIRLVSACAGRPARPPYVCLFSAAAPSKPIGTGTSLRA